MDPSVDMKRVKELILDRFKQDHRLGEAAGGSGHLSNISVTRIDTGKPLDTKIGKQPALEIPFTVETYTETEFMHAPEDDVYYTKKYAGVIDIDASMNVLGFTCE